MPRVRLSEKNIAEQAEKAANGLLIHWIGAKGCSRKQLGQDIRKEGNVTHLAFAGYIENVSCLRCRKEYYAQFKKAKS